ncbi:MAG: Gfo/Idh/MocA family oxidoreductase [Candidatus Magasanikbacteria bacterium]|nr:Gfo/Idh/MocA family oxidoreductase [Candidatus Magasanikbacteria bacterium]
MSQQPAILIVGGGSIGQRHLRNFLALGQESLAVVEPSAERAGEIRDQHHVSTFDSLTAALAAGAWQVAVICTPTAYHLEQAVQCARAGCDLFIEKPLADVDQGLEVLCDEVERQRRVVMIGSNWKFYPLFQTMKEWLDSGAIGRVLGARAEFGQYLPDWHPWEDYRQGYSANKRLGGGIMADCHEFDYLTWFLGDVARVVCLAKKVSALAIDVEDVAAVILEFKDGILGELHADYLQRFPRRSFDFIGETGTIHWDLLSKRAELLAVGKEPTRAVLPDGYDLNRMYIEEMKHFFTAVARRTETITPLAQGILVARLIAAARESARSGAAVNM